MKNILLPLFIILSAIVNIQAQFISKANYALAEKFRNIGLGSLFAQNSMTIYPRFINGTDKFWFDFRSSQGTSHYFVDPEEGVQKGKIPLCRIGYLISVSNRDTNKSRVPNTFWTPSSIWKSSMPD